MNKKEMQAKMEAIENKSQLKLQEEERNVEGSVEKFAEEFNIQLTQLSSQMSHDIEKETKQVNEKIDQLNKKTGEIEKNIEGISNFCLEDHVNKVETLQQLNPIEAFQRSKAIEQLVNRKPSQIQLVDSFLFGSAIEQMAFESLCLKWNIKHKHVVLPKIGETHEHLSDIFPVYGYQFKAQLKLTIYSNERIYLFLCLKDEEREGKEVDIKPLPKVTFIIKDLSGRNKHFIRCRFHSFNASLAYSQFGYYSGFIKKSEWNALISPCDASLEVLVLVEPPAVIKKPLSVDGAITDTIEHYSRKLQMEKQGLIGGHWSSPFLTHAGGYRVVVFMGLNWPSVFNRLGLVAGIVYLSGEFDSQLRMRFDQETSVTLINQLDATKNITVKQQAKKAESYWMAIASSHAIGSGGFIVNDSLTYHVTIKSIKK